MAVVRVDPDPDVDLAAEEFTEDHAHLVAALLRDEPHRLLVAEPLIFWTFVALVVFG